ncbi:uncharacterized protein LOC127353784 [Scomber scombrus]|uniref:Uncharacterized protein LOC127353784 n=1 Tax=Scomber scombrus TaxID=13677 RepID=A0AAV1P9I5_SCOSC
MPKLIPQVFDGVEVRPFHPPHSLILEVVSDKPRSVGAGVVILEFGPRLWRYGIATGCRISSRYLCIEIASNDDKPCFSRDGDAAPHHHTASTKKMLLSAAISIAFSASSPRPYDPTAVGRIWTHH